MDKMRELEIRAEKVYKNLLSTTKRKHKKVERKLGYPLLEINGDEIVTLDNEDKVQIEHIGIVLGFFQEIGRETDEAKAISAFIDREREKLM